MTTDTELNPANLIPEALSRAQQSGRLGEAPYRNHRVTRAHRLGYKARLALARLF